MPLIVIALSTDYVQNVLLIWRATRSHLRHSPGEERPTAVALSAKSLARLGLRHNASATGATLTVIQALDHIGDCTVQVGEQAT